MSEMKKCICGGTPCEPYWYSPSDGYQAGDSYYEIDCDDCGMSVFGDDKEDAIKKWNEKIKRLSKKKGWWNKLGTVEPKIDEDVLLLYADGIINRATYIGNGKFTDYVGGYELGTKVPDVDFPVLYWMSTPKTPKGD